MPDDRKRTRIDPRHITPAPGAEPVEERFDLPPPKDRPTLELGVPLRTFEELRAEVNALREQLQELTEQGQGHATRVILGGEAVEGVEIEVLFRVRPRRG